VSEIRIGCLQMELAKGDPTANFDKVRKFMDRAAEERIRFLLLPEMWSSGFAYRELSSLAGETPGLMGKIRKMAREREMAVIGSLPVSENGKIYNTAFAVDVDGSVRASYRKVHLFPLFKEDMFLEGGDRPVVTNLAGVDVGLAVCFDLRFPELFRKLALLGARIILIPSLWPRERLDHWRVLLKARAVENQYFVAGVNIVGRQGMTEFPGHSMIVDPHGEVLAEGGDSEGLIIADVDPGMVEKVRWEVNYLDCRVSGVDEFLNI